MSESEIIEVVRYTILVALQVGAPVMLVGLGVGLAIALLQALTQIQEITLVFVPKIIAIFLSLFFFFPFMSSTLVTFMEMLTTKITGIG